MPRPSLSKIFVVLSLAAVLTVPALSAAERRAPAHRASELWGFLARSWAKIGCIIDPSGRCTPAAADIGCIIDPDGRRCAPASADIGCTIDPDGRRCAPASADIGCGIDPNGRCGSGE
jgi:hypothetical protein